MSCKHQESQDVSVERRQRRRSQDSPPVAQWCPDCGAIRLRVSDDVWSEWSSPRSVDAEARAQQMRNERDDALGRLKRAESAFDAAQAETITLRRERDRLLHERG